MSISDIEALQTTIRDHWSSAPGDNAQRCVGRFFSRTRTGTKIVAKVTGNHGDYTVSIVVGAHGVTAACSCYVGKDGYCYHCAALAKTFLADPVSFQEIHLPESKQVGRHSACVRICQVPSRLEHGRKTAR